MSDTQTVNKSDDATRTEAALTPPVEVIEDASGITLYADLPGVPKDKLSLHVEGDALTIEGELALDVGGTPSSVEVYAFAPGLDPVSIEVQIDKGVLTVSGERKVDELPEQATRHIDERFSGRFRRVVSLPDDVDANAVTAKYRDGVLHVSLQRKQEAQPRRITIQ